MDAKACPSFPHFPFPGETELALKVEFWTGFGGGGGESQEPKYSGISAECLKSWKPLSSGVFLRTVGHSGKTRGS